jgi:DnaJ-class molecular chaperone
VSEKLQQATQKKKSYRFQVIRPTGHADDPNLHGNITITYFESLTGTRKLVDIPWGFHSRLFRVNVPAGISAGSRLRLRGLGKQLADGQQGDLLLKVNVQKE